MQTSEISSGSYDTISSSIPSFTHLDAIMHMCVGAGVTMNTYRCRVCVCMYMNVGASISIGLYTPINYFGRYATCSHKDGERSHIQFRETIGQEDQLRPRVNFRPAFGASYKTGIFYKYVVFKHPFSFLPNFFAAATYSLQCESTGVKSNNMDGPRRHSKYTMTMRLFPVSEKLPVSNHKKKDISNM